MKELMQEGTLLMDMYTINLPYIVYLGIIYSACAAI